MRKFLFFGLVLGFMLSGCATTKNISEAQVSALHNRISILEEELKQKQEENLELKGKILELEEKLGDRVTKMPTAGEIQVALKNAGFYQGKIDGQIGQKTKEAIRKFQEANGLTGDAVVGSRTWDKLSKYFKIQQASAGEIKTEINPQSKQTE